MSKLKQNISYHLFYQILAMLLPLITTPYIARVIGVEGTGTYSYTYAIVQYFVLFIMLGINNYGNRTIAKYRSDSTKLSENFWNLYVMQVILFVIVGIIYICYVNFFQSQYKLIMQIQFLFLVSSCFDINWLFFGLEKFKLTVLRNTVIKIASVLGIFIFVKDSNDLILYTILMSGANVASNLVLWPYVLKNIPFAKIRLNLLIKHFKKNLVLFVPVLAISIYNIMDKIMIGQLVSIADVSFYENAEKIINIPLNLLTALGTVMLPRMTNLIAKKNQEKVLSYINDSMELSLLIACPTVFGLVAVADDLVIVYLGNNFFPTADMVKWLSIIVIFKCWANIIRTEYLIPKEMDRSYIISVVLGAIFNFILNLSLIPFLGAIGAIIGTIIAELVVALYQTYAIRNELEISKYMKYLFKGLSTGLIMFIIVLGVGHIISNIYIRLFMQVLSGIIIYGILNYSQIKKIICTKIKRKKSIKN